jgi:hypothetical protein
MDAPPERFMRAEPEARLRSGSEPRCAFFDPIIGNDLLDDAGLTVGASDCFDCGSVPARCGYGCQCHC